MDLPHNNLWPEMGVSRVSEKPAPQMEFISGSAFWQPLYTSCILWDAFWAPLFVYTYYPDFTYQRKKWSLRDWISIAMFDEWLKDEELSDKRLKENFIRALLD